MLSVLLVSAVFGAQDKPAIKWMLDYAAAVKQAQEQKKLLIVHFWADW